MRGIKADFEWKWNDPVHLEAHRAEFLRPVEEILSEIKPLAAAQRNGGNGQLHTEWELGRVCGTSGLREVDPLGSESFWACRKGRTILSHLCLGERIPTSWICLWGWWEESCFVIHTLYPGRKAPREIHDAEILPEELPASIEFWRRHAIITEEGQFENAIRSTGK